MLTYYETQRLILRVLTPEYCDYVLHFYASNQSHFQPFDPAYPHHYYTSEYQRSSLSFEFNAYKNGTGVRYYVFKKEHPQSIIGTISFNNITYGCYQSACVGYKFDQKHLHSGFATESLTKGLEVMFNEVGLHRLEAFVHPDNLPSIRLIKRLGFTFEGISREYARIKNEWQDHKQFSLLVPTFLHQYPN